MISDDVRENSFFRCSHIRKRDLRDLKLFSCIDEENSGLANYIKEDAFNDEKNNSMRTYIVRSKHYNNEIVGYFSLKAGLTSTEVLKNTGEKELITLPGIELADFAINNAFIEKYPWYKGCGIILFQAFIRPIIEDISKYVGVKFIYIFALPNEKVIERYKEYGFKRLDKKDEDNLHSRIKPSYDDDCVFMQQPV